MPRRHALLVLLLLVCLVPRVWSAWHWETVCTDGVTYLGEAEALQHEDFETAFGPRGLNTYPVILTGLKKTGLDVIWVGKWWNVVMATLVVLPLFGWVRRQFDDQVAVVACLLYAFQPTLVRYAPLLTRDSTFWLLFNLAFYLIWRALTEIRWWLFPTAGAALSLAIHTRSEGWLLLIPLVLWSAFRFPAAVGARARLVAGTVICVAMIPVSIVLVNVTLLRDCPRWELGCASHIQVFRDWMRQPGSDQTRIAGEAPPTDAPAASKPRFKTTRQVGLRLVKSYTYVYGLLVLLGLWAWRHVYLRRDHQALLLMSVLLFAAIWIRCSRTDICVRYFLPTVFASFPWIALGTFLILKAMERSSRRLFAWGPRARPVLMSGLLGSIVMVSLFEANPGPVPRARQKVALGKWILHHLGPKQEILCVNSDARLAYYYAKGRGRACYVPPRFETKPLMWMLENRPPQVILLWQNYRDPDHPDAALDILNSRSELGYRQVPQERLPSDCEKVVVMIRGHKVAGTHVAAPDHPLVTKEVTASTAYRR